MSNFIEEFDRNNTPDESLKDSIIDIIESTLVDAPKGRTVSDEAVFTVAERALTASASLEVDVQCFNALREVQNFLTLALEGPSANGEMSHTDLLPLGHPSSTAQHDLPASTLRTLTANWIASDPRIKSDEARSIVAAVYASNPYSVDYAFNIVRLQALAADQVPVELTIQPLVAFGNPYAGKNSSWHRRMRANRQRRDDEGQFAEMGGGIRFYVRKGSSIYSIVGKVAGIPENDPNGIDIEVTNVKGFKNGIYTLPSNITSTFKAILPEHAVSNLVPMAKNSNVPFVDMKDLKRKDLPTSWYSTKVAATVSGLANRVTPSRSFVTGDGYQASLYNKPDEALQKRIAEAQQKFGSKIIGQFGTDQLNPDKPVYELISSKRGQEEVVGYAQDWASTQQLATQEDRDYPDTENEPTSTAPAARTPEPQEEPAVEDIPEEVYEPVDPDANMPEGWGKISDGYYQSKDGKNFVKFGDGTTGTAPVYNFDPITGIDFTSYEPVTIPDTFSVYDLATSPLLDTPIGVGFSWGDVDDIINSADADLPVVPMDPSEWDDIEPSFMEFADPNEVEALRQKVKEDSKKWDAKAQKQTAEVAVFEGSREPKKVSGPLYRAYNTHIITDPAVGELFDDMFLNPQNYSMAEAASFKEIIEDTQQINPVKNERGFPAFFYKMTPKTRQALKKALAARKAPEGQESRVDEIIADLYNATYKTLNEVNSWPWNNQGGYGNRTTAKQIATEKGQADPTPEFLISDLSGDTRPTPGKIVKVESLLRNKILQDLIDDGDDPDQNYPDFQQAFRRMTEANVAYWLKENNNAPDKEKYVPKDKSKFYTNLGLDGASSRQLTSLERMIGKGLLTEEEAANVLERLPDLTEPEVSKQFMSVFKPRELAEGESRILYNVSKGLPIDHILAEEGMEGVPYPANYVPTFNLDGTPIAGQPAPAPTPTPTPTPTPEAEQPAPEDSTEEPEAESPLDVDYVNPGILKVGNRVVVNGVPKVISDINDLDGFYAVSFDDGTSETYNQADDVPVLYGPVPKPFEPDLVDNRQVVQSDESSIFWGTPYHIRWPIEIDGGDIRLDIADDIGGHVVKAISLGYPIDRMQLPDWYKNQDSIEYAVRRMLNDNTFSLESYTPNPEKIGQEDWLVSLFNDYVMFAQQDVDRAPKFFNTKKWVEAVLGVDLPYDVWKYNKSTYDRIMSPPGQGVPNIVQAENVDEDVRIVEDARVAGIQKSGIQYDLSLLRDILDGAQAMLADALRERAVTAQGRKIIQGAITDISTLKPKMTLRNKNLPTPADVNEVLARVRDGLIDAGEAHTYGKLNRPSKELLEILSEMSGEINRAIGIYKAGALTDRTQLMEFEDDNPKPKMTYFDPPAFEGPAFEEIKGITSYQELVDFLYSKDIYIFDFETTGKFNPIDPEMKNDPIQMAIVKVVNGKIDSQMSTYVNPESKLSAWTLANVGDGQGGRISSKFLRQQPTKAEAMRMFLENIPEGSIIAGHNGLMFDIEVLNRTLSEAGLQEFKYGGFIDTFGLARYIMPKWSAQTPDAPFRITDSGLQVPAHSLEALVNYFGLSNNGRHEADSDVVSTYEVFKSILQRGLDGKGVNGPEFNYEASTNGWDREKYEFEAEVYKSRVANYIANRIMQLFTTQDAVDNSARVQALYDNAESILKGIAASESDDRISSQFMEFPESEPNYPTEKEQAELLKKIDAFELDLSFLDPQPSEEGVRIIKAMVMGLNTVVQAYAGTGKTTVLRQGAEVIERLNSERVGMYAAFGKQNQLEAERVMPSTVNSQTFGSIAFNAQANAYMVSRINTDQENRRQRRKNPQFQEPKPIWRTSYAKVRDMFGVEDITLSNGIPIPALDVTKLAVGALNAWILSKDQEISEKHFFSKNNKTPFDYSAYQNQKQIGATGEQDESIFPAKKLIRLSKMMWFEMTQPYNPQTPQLQINLEDTIKNAQLAKPNFRENVVGKKGFTVHGLNIRNILRSPNYIMVDEAQDMNPANVDIFQIQSTKYNNEISTTIVGDTFQQIFGFRASENAVKIFGRDIQLPLTQSYRYGPRIAKLANKVLSFLGVETNIIGNPNADTQIVEDNVETMNYLNKNIDAIIARTNYGVLTISAALGVNTNFKASTTPQYREKFKTLTATVKYLQTGKYPPRKMYEDLSKFNSWEEVKEAANQKDEEAGQIVRFMNRLSKAASDRGMFATDYLQEIIDNLRAKVNGFKMPEKDPKTGKIPTTAELGNNLKYEIVGDNILISDAVSGWVSDDEALPIKGTRNNKGMLKSVGYSYKVDETDDPENPGQKIKSNHRYEKPIDDAKDKLSSAETMLQALVNALSGEDADVFTTNAHGAKGLEYDNVVVWTDFETPETHAARIKSAEDKGEDTSNILPKWKEEEEINLAYVVLTRAKKAMYTGGLSFYLSLDPEKGEKEEKPSNRPDTSKVTTDYVSAIDVLKRNKKFLEEQLDLAEMLKNAEQAAEIKKSIKDVSAQIKKEKAKLTKEERAKLEEEEKIEAEIKALEEKLAEAEQSKRAKERKAEIAEYKKNLKKAEEAKKKAIAEWPARMAQARKDDIAWIENMLPSLYEEKKKLEDKIADPATGANDKEDIKNRPLAGVNRRIAEYTEKLNELLNEEKSTPQLMQFEGEPGEFNYEAFNQESIANLEKSISDAKAQLELPTEDRTDGLTSSQIKDYIASLNQQIADIKADPDYYRKIDQSNLATAKEALQQLLSGNLDPKLLTYAERWALRYKDGSLGGPAGKNRSMILGLRAKIEELSLRLGESDGTQTDNPMLMAFDAADNIDDNQAVTPAPGEPGSDENPIQVDLTEEIKSVNKSNQEVVSTVVASILEAMEKGIIPWKKPWTGEGGFLPTSGATGRVYRGLNLLSLLAASMVRDYKGTRWYTKNAISKLGGYVNKREDGKDPGVIITFVSTKKYDKEEQVQVPDPDNPDKTKTETRTVTKKFAKMGLDIVYNEDEIQGIELPQLVRKDPPAISEVEGIVLDSYTDKPPIQYVPQDSAYWSPSEDVIRLPLRAQFNSTEEYLDTLFHELTHSTGHQNRLDRKDLLENYGTHKDVRAREELIAEIGSAILAQMMNVDTSIDNVAAYVQSWATWLKGDPNALHEAASLASKAVEHILGGYWASVDGMVDLNEETEAKTVEAIDMPQGEITGEDGTSGGLGKGVNYRIEGESVILMGNTTANKEIIKATGITPEGKKRPFTFIFHGRNKYWFVTLSGETGLGDRMRILAELKKNLDGDATVTPG